MGCQYSVKDREMTMLLTTEKLFIGPLNFYCIKSPNYRKFHMLTHSQMPIKMLILLLVCLGIISCLKLIMAYIAFITKSIINIKSTKQEDLGLSMKSFCLCCLISDRLSGRGDELSSADNCLELLRNGLLHELVSLRDHDVHLTGLGRHNLSPHGLRIEEHLTSVSLFNRDGGHLSKHLHLNGLTVDELDTAHDTAEHDSSLLASVNDNVVTLSIDLDGGALALVDIHGLIDLNLVDLNILLVLEELHI